MKFGLFYELQLPKPWDDNDEERIVRETIEQNRVRRPASASTPVWEVEHHFLEEYSHSPAPRSSSPAPPRGQRTSALATASSSCPPAITTRRASPNVSRRSILLSNGRVEFGTGESSSEMELGGFGVNRADKKAMWQESLGEMVR